MQEALIPLPGVDSCKPLPIVLHGCLRVRLLQDQAVQELLLPVRALKETAHGNFRVGQHDQHMAGCSNFLQHFQGDVGVHEDRPALGCRLREDSQLQHFALPRDLIDPGLICFRRPPDEFVPVLQIPAPGQRREFLFVQPWQQPVVIVFLALDAVMLFRQQMHHGGLSGVGGAGDEIYILKIHGISVIGLHTIPP